MDFKEMHGRVQTGLVVPGLDQHGKVQSGLVVQDWINMVGCRLVLLFRTRSTW
jgi:hypothetical protein